MARWKVVEHLIECLCKDNCVGVEIGVAYGKTSLYLLENCKQIKHLYSIDPYIRCGWCLCGYCNFIRHIFAFGLVYERDEEILYNNIKVTSQTGACFLNNIDEL